MLTFFTIITGAPTQTIPTGGGGGGGGGGAAINEWWEEDPCNHGGIPGCGDDLLTGWVATPEPDTGPYSVLWVDTIGISNSIQSVYPCLYAFLNDSLPNINYLAQLAGASVFKDSAYMHLTFDTSTIYTQQGQASAITYTDSVQIDGNGFTHFNATIKFNGWYLRKATKEYMVSTIIHESIHAIFKLRWKQYQQWLINHNSSPIDSFFMKEHFPIYWENYIVNGVPSGAVNDHQIMATDYYNLFNSLVSQFYNPAAPQALRDSVIKAMNYGGLQETTAWKMLPSQGVDTCKYKNIDITAAHSFIGTFNALGCANFTTHYADSLKLRSSCN